MNSIKKGDLVLIIEKDSPFGLYGKVCRVRYCPGDRYISSQFSDTGTGIPFNSQFYHVITIDGDKKTGAYEKFELRKLTKDEAMVELL